MKKIELLLIITKLLKCMAFVAYKFHSVFHVYPGDRGTCNRQCHRCRWHRLDKDAASIRWHWCDSPVQRSPSRRHSGTSQCRIRKYRRYDTVDLGTDWWVYCSKCLPSRRRSDSNFRQSFYDHLQHPPRLRDNDRLEEHKFPHSNTVPHSNRLLAPSIVCL